MMMIHFRTKLTYPTVICILLVTFFIQLQEREVRLLNELETISAVMLGVVRSPVNQELVQTEPSVWEKCCMFTNKTSKMFVKNI